MSRPHPPDLRQQRQAAAPTHPALLPSLRNGGHRAGGAPEPPFQLRWRPGRAAHPRGPAPIPQLGGAVQKRRGKPRNCSNYLDFAQRGFWEQTAPPLLKPPAASLQPKTTASISPSLHPPCRTRHTPSPLSCPFLLLFSIKARHWGFIPWRELPRAAPRGARHDGNPYERAGSARGCCGAKAGGRPPLQKHLACKKEEICSPAV